MTDERAREHARQAASGDQQAAAAFLRQRLRIGELTQEQVELAARLGHAVAKVFCPGVELLDWKDDESLLRLFGQLDPRILVLAGADWAQRALHVWAEHYPNDKSLDRALEAARTWARRPREETSKAARAASREVEDARLGAEGSPDAVRRAAMAVAHLAFYAGADPAEYCYHPLVVIREVARINGPDAEYEWQRLRLAAHVLDEV